MLRAFSIKDIGKKRNLNQDYIYASEEKVGSLPNIFIVADGMGGHKAGEYASKYTVETIVDEIRKSENVNSLKINPQEVKPIEIMRQAIKVANEGVRKQAREHTDMFGMGTTVVAATCLGNHLYVANVGDSRLYVVNGEMKQITRDHSLVEEMVRMGGIDRESARNHPDKNIITRAIGAKEDVEVDFFEVEISTKDTILMCSDGLTNMLEDEEIRRILQEDTTIEAKAGQLVEAANSNGGKDNIAVIIIEPFVNEE